MYKKQAWAEDTNVGVISKETAFGVKGRNEILSTEN